MRIIEILVKMNRKENVIPIYMHHSKLESQRKGFKEAFERLKIPFPYEFYDNNRVFTRCNMALEIKRREKNTTYLHDYI